MRMKYKGKLAFLLFLSSCLACALAKACRAGACMTSFVLCLPTEVPIFEVFPLILCTLPYIFAHLARFYALNAENKMDFVARF